MSPASQIATSVRRFRGNPVRSPRRKLILILAGTGYRLPSPSTSTFDTLPLQLVRDRLSQIVACSLVRAFNFQGKLDNFPQRRKVNRRKKCEPKREKKSNIRKINNGGSRMICYQLRGRIDVDPECVRLLRLF
ncbi:hypothetical protein AFLA70_363g001191 [Aspergillus flavus AF70]|nr:hypothetical protein AFLA70_363g001191 [Aspergillus flavus AF70]